MKKLPLLLVCLAILGLLAACAARGIEVRPRGEVDVGFGIGR